MTALLDPNGACDVVVFDPGTVRGTADVSFGMQDMRIYTGIATAILSVLCTVTGTVAVKLQDSADGSTGWADIAGAAFPTLTAANEVRRLSFNVGATRGFVRVNIVVGAGATYVTNISVLAKRT